MSSKASIISVVLLLLLAGCVGRNIPNTAPEYRELVKSSPGTIHESFTIKRSYRNTVKLLRKQSKKCLNMLYKTKTEHAGPALFKYGTENKTLYRPKLVKSRNMTSLITRFGSYEDGKVTDEEIISIVDVRPVSKKVTKVTMYSGAYIAQHVNKGIKHWLKGTNMGCPK